MPSKASKAAADDATHDAANRVLSNFASETDIDPDDIPSDTLPRDGRSNVSSICSEEAVYAPAEQQETAHAPIVELEGAGAQPEAEDVAAVIEPPESSTIDAGAEEAPAVVSAAGTTDESAGRLADEAAVEEVPDKPTVEVVAGATGSLSGGAVLEADGGSGEGDHADSDFVYEEGEHPVAASKPVKPAGSNSLLLHNFAALRGVEEVRGWFDAASEAQLLSLVGSVRELHDAWLQSQAQLINNEVMRKMKEQSLRAVTLASELSDECDARTSRHNSLDPVATPAMSELEEQAAELQVQLRESREANEMKASEARELEDKLRQMELRLAVKEQETEQLTEQLQQAILMHKGVSEEAFRKCKK
eukprot:CAMPEP_0183364202 /NCGR_PEP_ID=MMETSP0164_2-20130417/78911_1 /TAXON_ID=221442 /ORGANISM="Coccolithus pelagicus ssp braarudi, Strain PLY182g" /LENGTH=361 /DNA_ID=CAMNT_0025539451 /DNA_START=9 /DNA_END=1094 /DNA_ORIENTATION=+